MHHSWPGNVRELRNYLERCTALRKHVPLTGSATPNLTPPTIDSDKPWRQARRDWVEFFEQRYLEELLQKHKNNVSAAARAAGVDRVHFHRLLQRAGLR